MQITNLYIQFSAGEGLKKSNSAFLEWIKEIQGRFNNVVAGLKADSKIYLAVWNLSDNKSVKANIKGVKKCKIAYPSDSDVTTEITNNELYINFPRRDMTVFLEIEVM